MKNQTPNLKYSFLFISIFFSYSLIAQPYEKAPQTKKKVKRITEWVRPDLKSKSIKGMISNFDINGHLLNYISDEDDSILNTYHILNKKGTILETREGKGIDLFVTKYFYNNDNVVKEVSFRGKQNRTVHFYNKKKQETERKVYSRGLELGKKYQLKDRIVYQYNKRNQLVGEKIMTYNLPNSKEITTRKKVYYYHSDYHYLIKSIEYDYDGTVSVVEDYAYTKLKDVKASVHKVKSIITNYLKDGTVSTKEFLYQKGKIWQRISTERGIQHVEIFNDGRLIRLRSYNNEKIYRVVDYQYEYF